MTPSGTPHDDARTRGDVTPENTSGRPELPPGTLGTTSYDARRDLESSLRLGIDVESDDPSLAPIVLGLSAEQVEWIASWLAGEGFSR